MGWRAVELLEAKLAAGSAELRVCHQLMPELAAILEGVPLVVFLDASVENAPGEVVQRPVQPEGRLASSHALTPGQLLGLARDLHGTAPCAILISGGVFEMTLSDSLTESAEICAGHMAELAASFLAKSRRGMPTSLLS